VTFDFAVHVDRETVDNREPEKCDEICWYTLKTLPTPMHSQWPVFYEKYHHLLSELVRNCAKMKNA
jgi:hypothetical protein